MRSIIDLFQSREERLTKAAEEGYLAQVIKSLNQGALIESKNDSGRTALMCSIRMGHLKIVKYLLRERADVEARGQHGKTSLIYAAVYGYLEIVQCLVVAGSSIEAKDSSYNTALMWAVYKGHLKVVQYLAKSGADLSAARVSDGATALMWAAEQNHLEISQYLVGAGAAIEAKDRYGKTALILASSNGHLRVVQYLLDAGAAIEAKDRYGKTALILASSNGHLRVVQYLLDAGAAIEAKDIYGKTALTCATESRHTEIMRYLADVETSVHRDAEKLTSASETGGLKKVREVIEKRPAMEVEGNKDKIALIYSRRFKHTEKRKAYVQQAAVVIGPGVMASHKEMSLSTSSFGNLQNMATRQELSVVGGIDVGIISWYESSYTFIQSAPELKDYYEASNRTLFASFNSLQIKDAGIVSSDSARNNIYFGSFLSVIFKEVPVVRAISIGLTSLALAASNYSQAQYASNLWSHIRIEKNLSLYASMLACGMTLVFQESLKSGILDKANTISSLVMKHCQSIFDEPQGKIAQTSVLSKFAGSTAAKDGVSDSLGLVRSMMCVESRGEMQKDRLHQLFDIAKQVRDSRKGDRASYAADPFSISVMPVSANPLSIGARITASEVSPASGGVFVSAEKFASFEAELVLLKQEAARSSEDAAKNKAKLAELELKMADQDGPPTVKNIQKNTKIHTHMMVQGAYGEVSAARNPAAFFGADIEGTQAKILDMQSQIKDQQAQIELLTQEVSLLRESQEKGLRALNAADR